MFSPNPKNDPLLSAIQGVIAENDKHREAVDRANKHFKVTDKRQLPHDLHSEYDKMLTEAITKSTPMVDVIRDFEKSDAPQFEGKSKEKRRQMAIAAKMAMMNEELKGNQHKIDANKNGKVDAQDFKMLRDMKEDVMMEAIMNILEQDSFTQAEYNTIMESPFGVAFQTARREGKAEFEFGGKKYNSRQAGETEDQWRANLAKSSAPPVPMARPADRMPSREPVNVVRQEPAANDLPVPGSKRVDGTTVPSQSDIGPGASYSDVQRFIGASQANDAIKRMQPPPAPAPEPRNLGTTPAGPVAGTYRDKSDIGSGATFSDIERFRSGR
jgi:hypothetical protein